MINKRFFGKLRKEYTAYDAARRELIKTSGDILSRAKQAIFALHRGDAAHTASLLKEADVLIRRAAVAFRTTRGLEYEGSYRAALEEYVEACLYERFLAGKPIDRVDAPGVDEDIYLGGVLDFTGEVVRHAVAAASRRDVKEVQRCQDAVTAVAAELITMNITGPLRPKYDQLRQNIRKIEEIVYDLSLSSLRTK